MAKGNIEFGNFKYSKMVLLGYITKNGTPIKCVHCGSEKESLFNTNKILSKNKMLIQFDCVCSSCKSIIGHWNNGVWTVIYEKNNK